MQFTRPYDLSVILDSGYWKHKANCLQVSKDDMETLALMNTKDVLGTWDQVRYHHFLNFSEPVETENFRVKNLFWQNDLDSALPYQSGFRDTYWNVSTILRFLELYFYIDLDHKLMFMS